ncbi:MAG TPA: fibronectin type III domain-containing protein [Jatrophihabitans sp.]|nr:fibronectin type III domain-containing protein [Jatrophihabitans sp.]
MLSAASRRRWSFPACRTALLTALAFAVLASFAAPASAASPSWRASRDSGAPWGRLGPATSGFGLAYLRGVAIDPDTTAPIPVRVLLDGRLATTVTADVPRPAVGTRHPHYGPDHGYRASVAVPDSTHRLCVVAVNVGGGHDTSLGCLTLTGLNDPVGALTATSHSTTGITVSGWALDPDVTDPIQVSFTVDGTTTGPPVTADATANLPAQWSAYGTAHGFTATLPATTSAHTLCATGTNLGSGIDASLGCANVPAWVPSPPSAPQLGTASATAHRITVTWLASADDGGAPVTGYQVTGNGATQQLPATATTATLTGLAPATTYQVSVAAVNSVGAGTAATVKVTTKQAPIPPQTTPAPVSTSHYLRNLTGASAHDVPLMRAMGAKDAGYNPSGHRYLVLQDIGAQSGNGVLLSATIKWISYAALVRALNAYVDGYASTQKSNAPMLLAIGTNNDGAVSSAEGTTWADKVVDPVAAHAAQYPNIVVAGADDMEPGFSATVGATRAWLSGFLGATKQQFVFNGSADGCPTGTGTRCNNGWTTGDLHWLSAAAGLGRIIALPQIYNTAMPHQWHTISADGAHPVYFGGPLTEWTACDQTKSCYSMTNVTAWSALFSALGKDPRTKMAAMPYGTDLRVN